MKPVVVALVSVHVSVSVSVRAGTADPLPSPSPSPAPQNEITLGVTATFGDDTNPEFLEYRDVPRGFTVPSFRFAGRAGRFDYDLAGRDAGQDDQRYRGRLASDRFALSAHLDELPHRLGEGRSPFGDALGRFSLPLALRRDVEAAVERRAAAGELGYFTLAPIAGDILLAGRAVDVGFLGRTSGASLRVEAAPGLVVAATVERRRRDGTRASGIGFGLQNAVEVAEPVDDVTDGAVLDVQLERGFGVVRGSAGVSSYRNAVETLTVDNPLRATASTAPGAHLGPSNATTAGGALAQAAVAPDNDALTATAGGVLRLPLRTRLTADVTIARWRRAGTGPNLSFTTNTAIVEAQGFTPPQDIEATIHTGAQTVQLASSPWAGLAVRARFRRYELEDQSGRWELPGVARLDAVWEGVPRRTVPYSHSKRRGEASIGYALGGWRLEAGSWREEFERTFRETEETEETAWLGSLSGALPGDGHLLLFYEHAHRDFEAYDSRLSPGASRVNVHPVRSLGGGRRYDQAVRDRDRVGARAEIAPAEAVTVAASYTLDLRRHPQTPYGLVETRAHAASADVSLAPGGAWTAHAFYALEVGASFQRTRHSPQPTIAVDLRNVWDASLEDVAHSVGAGFAADLDGGRTALRFDALLQHADATGDFDSPPGGIPDEAEDIAAFDDVRWLSLSADLERKVGGGWAFGVAALWDAQAVASVFDEDRPDYVPGAFVLGPGALDYGAFALHARVTRRW